MEEISGTRKGLTIMVMTVATVVMVGLSLSHLAEKIHAATAGGEADMAYLMGSVFGETLVDCFLAWLVTLAILIPVQGRFSVWKGPIFLPILIVIVLGVTGAVAGLPYLLNNSGDGAVLNKAMADDQARILSEQHRLATDLEALGYPYFVHATALGAPQGLERGRAKIKTARDILQKSHQREYAMIADIRQKIAALPVSQSNRDKTLAAFNAGLSETHDRGERSWKLLDATMAEQEAMLDDLAKAKGRWKTDADKMQFTRQSDLDTYNRHITAINKYTAELAEIRNQRKAAAPATGSQ